MKIHSIHIVASVVPPPAANPAGGSSIPQTPPQPDASFLGARLPAFHRTTPVRVTPLVVEGRLVRVAQHGNNSPVLGFARLNGKRRKVVFKQEINRNADQATLLKNHIKAVVASRIMEKFGAPTVMYYPARMTLQDGSVKDGIISEFVECKNLYEDPSLLEKITNPDEAVSGSIISAWLGDSDRIMNEGNVWVRPDGKVIFGDFGYAFKRRVTALGLPKTNLKIMKRYATKKNVEETIARITSLSDQDISRLVHEAGKGVPGWNRLISDEISEILMENRDELCRKNPFAEFYETGGEGPHIEIEHGVMLRVRGDVRSLASASSVPQGASPEEDEPYFLALPHKNDNLQSVMKVHGWQIPQREREEQQRIRRQIKAIVHNIPDWNKEIEDQLMIWILFHEPSAEEFFRSRPENFYPLLKFMKNLFAEEERVARTLGIQ